MGWRDFFIVNKNQAGQNNYKLDLFNTISNGNQIANMSVINKYFNNIYGADSAVFNAFTVNQTIDNVYVSQASNKIGRLQDYRNMAMYGQIAQAIDMICYSANIPDENQKLIDIKIDRPDLQVKDIQIIKNAIQDYLDLFDFDNNIQQYFRTLIVEGQLCWQNIVAKDDIDQGIIGINIIPNQAYEFCYDMKTRKKIGIMITNTSADNFNLTNLLGMGALNGATRTILGAYSSLNCYQELLEDKCIVLPFEELTYVDSGVYSPDNRAVYSALQRAKRPFNQLKLIEDAILIYRVSRSPEKYVFNVDIGKMPKSRGEMEVAQLMKQFGTKKTYDPNTGTVGKAYDPMQMTQNFWFVKGADSQGITVSPLQANHNFGNLDDLDYFVKKLLRALNIPISRIFGEQAALINNGDESGITADELNFAKFIMQQQNRLAYGLLNGVITHLKYTGIWDLYKLTKNKIKIVVNPPIEYIQYRRQKLLESKATMLKTVLGEEVASKLFSAEMALQIFMGWDKQKIQRNKLMKFNETIEDAKLEFLKTKITEGGNVDIAPDGATSFKELLQKDILTNQMGGGEGEGGEGNEGDEEEGDEFSSESTGDQLNSETEGEQSEIDQGGI